MENYYRGQSNVDPSKKKGDRRIPTTVWHALEQASLSGAEFRILLCIIDKTLGWKDKPSDFISYSQFKKETRLSRQSISIAIKKLESKRIIVINRDSKTSKYLFNMHWDTWIFNLNGLHNIDDE